mgnify:FL=1
MKLASELKQLHLVQEQMKLPFATHLLQLLLQIQMHKFHLHKQLLRDIPAETAPTVFVFVVTSMLFDTFSDIPDTFPITLLVLVTNAMTGLNIPPIK